MGRTRTSGGVGGGDVTPLPTRLVRRTAHAAATGGDQPGSSSRTSVPRLPDLRPLTRVADSFLNCLFCPCWAHEEVWTGSGRRRPPNKPVSPTLLASLGRTTLAATVPDGVGLDCRRPGNRARRTA